MKKIGWIGALIVAVGCPTFVAVSQASQSVSQQVGGRWEGQDVDQPVELWFSPSGRLVVSFRLGFASNERLAVAVNYSIDSKPKPMHLDLQLDQPASAQKREEPVFTIFEFPDSRASRLQMKNLKLGQPRSTQFEDEATLSKASEGAIAFPDVTQAEQSKDGERRLVMRHLALSALHPGLKMQQAPSKLNQSGLSHDTTQHYRYQLQAKPNHLTLFARPKKGNLKSHIAVVLRFPVQGQDYGAKVRN